MTAASAQPASARQGPLARHPLVSYFLNAFAFSWALLLPVVLSKDGAGLLQYRVSSLVAAVFAPASLLGPSLAALAVTTEVAAAARYSARGSHPRGALGPVALARLLGPFPSHLGHTAQGHRHGLRPIRPRPHSPRLHHPFQATYSPSGSQVTPKPHQR